MISRRVSRSSLALALAIGCSHGGEGSNIAPANSTTQSAGGNVMADEVPTLSTPEAPDEAPAVPPPDIFAEDLEQTPYWVLYSNSRQRPRRNVAVQIPDPAAELAGATSPIGPGFVGVLLCEVEVTEHKDWDSPGLFHRHVEPDIMLLGGSTRTLLEVQGPEDTYAFVASFPNVQLDPGFVLHVRDHDTNRDDQIEALRLPIPMAATPYLEVVGERARARCAGVPAAQAEQRALASFGALAPVLTRLEARAPAAVEEVGRRLHPAREHVRGAAAWLGWAHPSVRSVVRRLNVVEARWAIADAETRAPPVGTESQMPHAAVSILDQTCSERVCRARVRATYSQFGPVVSLVILTPTGEVVTREIASDPVRPPHAQTHVRGSESYTHTFEWTGDAAAFASVRHHNDEALVRLR